ncbi:MAG: glycine--tRNA ligase subunit beta [Ardenticatenaceae bacterium]
MTKEPLTMQEIILRLQNFWAEQGALIWQPYHTEVGAGTANPGTILRVLGPEPWNVAYVEPSIRPDDSRYGDNPNRLQMHTQFQVILKPDPGNPQELYLASLEAIGIDRRAHDIRFVEDNWESPALGAWGLGWEVWLDGMEITQFTYFQQSGGSTLDPVAVELTYGLERITMRLQNVDHFKNIQYAPGLTYGEIFLQNEFEHSTYNLDVANTERVKQMFELYEQEARHLLELGLTIPAYDYILKTSHTFNILDSRGGIGVTERAAYFNRMRNLSRGAAKSWLKTREEMGFPLLKEKPATPPVHDMSEKWWPSEGKAEFVLEIGTEELPAEYVDIAIAALSKSAPKMFKDLRLSYESLTVNGTPRRLVVRVTGLNACQSDLEKVVRGPAARVAFDKEGNPTRAVLGFARSKGLDVSELEVRKVKKTDYVFGVVRQTGRAAGGVLSEALPKLLADIPWPKSMRWNASNVAFGRPLRWMIALLDEMVIPFSYAGMHSGCTSRGLRSDSSPAFDVCDAKDYLDALKEQGIVVSKSERKAQIWDAAQALAAEVGGSVPEQARGDLLNEVANLVEHPTPIRGTFEEAYLALPREVLVTVMRKHQRYFPVQKSDGDLLPYFVTIANGNVGQDTVRHGNQEVIRARYSDAQFFWDRDIKQGLEAFRPTLKGLTFQAKLGSMLDKSERLGQTVPWLAEKLGLSAEESASAERAAYLAKADLVTLMVMDFSSLQGIIGRHYALRSGESEAVAYAIEEHYSNNPASLVGMVVGLADRLDSLVGLFAVGKAPKASADPFAQRRAAIGVVELLTKRALRFDLREAIDIVAATQPVEVSPKAKQNVLEFIRRRLEQWLLDQKIRHDVVNASLAARGHDPAGALESTQQLGAVVGDESFQTTLTAYSRPARITRGKKLASDVDPALFEEQQEHDLWHAYNTAANALDNASDFNALLAELTNLRAPIDNYFDNVFVMAKDKQVRANRLALCKRVADLTTGIVALSEVQGF